MNKKKLALTALVLSFAALACTGLPNMGAVQVQLATLLADSGLSDEAQSMAATMMAGGTAVPVETLVAQFGEQASGAIIYLDDFSDADSGWPVDTFAEGSTSYYNGQYRIAVNETNYAVWSVTSSGSYADTRAEVDAVKLGGTDENEFGLLCRFVDNGNFYAATIASDGYYFIWRRINYGEWEMVGMESGEFSEAIYTGAQTNHIRLDCIGSAIALYANDTLLREVHDSSLTSGDAGLYAGTFDVAGVDVVFDNFVIVQP